MKWKLCLALTLWLLTFVDIILLWVTSYNFPYRFLFESPVSVFRNMFPRFFWLVFVFVKFHPFVLIALSVSLGFYCRKFLKWFFDEEPQTSQLNPDEQEIPRVALFFKNLFRSLADSIGSENHKPKLLLLFLLALCVRLVFLSLSDNYFNGDSGARLYKSYFWAFKPKLFSGFDWLPMQFYMLGSIIWITGDVVWSPRVFTLLLGALSVVPFYFLVQHIWGTFNAGLSSIFFALRPIHIKLSVITMSEVPFLFLMIMAAFYFFKYMKDTSSRRNMYLTVFYLSCAGMMRMEAWVYSALFTIVLFINGNSLTTVAKFLSRISIVPLFVIILSWLSTGDPFRSINYSDFEVTQWFLEYPMLAEGNLTRSLENSFTYFSRFFIPLGIFLSLTNRKSNFFLLIFLIPFLLTVYKMFNLTLTGQERYFTTAIVLSLPFYFVAIERIAGLFTASSYFKFLLAVAFAVAGVAQKAKPHLGDQLMYMDLGKFREGFTESALWARDSLPHGAKLFVSGKNVSEYNWIVYSHSIISECMSPEESKVFFTKRRSARVKKYYPKHEVLLDVKRNWLKSKHNVEDLLLCLQNKSISYLIILAGGRLDEDLQFKKNIEFWKGYQFILLKNFHGNMIYRIEYQSQAP